MNINEKVEQMLQIAISLKSQVQGLDEMNETKSSDFNEELDDLEWEKEALKNDINDLKNALMQQNEKILSLVRKQNEKLVETIEADKLAPHLVFKQKVSKHSKLFPVQTLEELDKLEAFISDENLNELVTVVQQILAGQGVLKSMASVLSTKCCVDCNVYGINNKRRLLNYKKFMDLLFRAAYCEGYTQKAFLDEVRRGLRIVKNRNHNLTFRNRQLQRQEEECNTNDNEEESQMETIDESEILPCFNKKRKICM